MKTKTPDVIEKGRVRGRVGEWYGHFVAKGPRGDHLFLVVSAGDADAWAECGFPPPPFEHVSVSVRPGGRCPTWEEMCFVKDLCWGDEETVIQYHPPRSEYVNQHQYVLHLWKPVGVTIPLPPSLTVGLKPGQTMKEARGALGIDV